MKKKSTQPFQIGSRVFLKSDPLHSDGTIIDIRMDGAHHLLVYWRQHPMLKEAIAGYQINELVREA